MSIKNKNGKVWSNLTIIIKDMKFKVEFNYEDLQNSEFDSFQRHIIWRSKYLNKGIEKVNKTERQILEKYYAEYKENDEKEIFEEDIHIKNVNNIVDYQTEYQDNIQNIEYAASKNDKKSKNQILMMDEEQ